ncbi:MAG TPA: integrin alpha, partial [bacterium]
INGDEGGHTHIVADAPVTIGYPVCTTTPSQYGEYPDYSYSCPSESYAYVNTLPGVVTVFGNSSLGQPSGVQDFASTLLSFRGSSGSFTGTALAAGRVNGDNFDDLVVGAVTSIGAYYYHTSGKVYVVFGTSGSIAQTPGQLDGYNGGLTILSSGDTYDHGAHVAVGDINGDGVDDIILSEIAYVSYAYTYSGQTYYEYAPAGRVHVIFGQSSGFAVSGGVIDTYYMDPSIGFTVTLPIGAFVNSLAVGDLNGDGTKDLVIGSRSLMRKDTSQDNLFEAGLNGAAVVVFGSSTPANVNVSDLDGTNGTIVMGPTYGLVGAAVTAGDIDNDGVDDLIFSSPTGTASPIAQERPSNVSATPMSAPLNLPYTQAGLVYVVFGVSGGTWAGARLPTSDSLFGIPIDVGLGGPVDCEQCGTTAAPTSVRKRWSQRFAAARTAMAARVGTLGAKVPLRAKAHKVAKAKP